MLIILKYHIKYIKLIKIFYVLIYNEIYCFCNRIIYFKMRLDDTIFHQIFSPESLSTKIVPCDHLSRKQILKSIENMKCVRFSIDYLVRNVTSKWLFPVIQKYWKSDGKSHRVTEPSDIHELTKIMTAPDIKMQCKMLRKLLTKLDLFRENTDTITNWYYQSNESDDCSPIKHHKISVMSFTW